MVKGNCTHINDPIVAVDDVAKLMKIISVETTDAEPTDGLSEIIILDEGKS